MIFPPGFYSFHHLPSLKTLKALDPFALGEQCPPLLFGAIATQCILSKSDQVVYNVKCWVVVPRSWQSFQWWSQSFMVIILMSQKDWGNDLLIVNNTQSTFKRLFCKSRHFQQLSEDFLLVYFCVMYLYLIQSEQSTCISIFSELRGKSSSKTRKEPKDNGLTLFNKSQWCSVFLQSWGSQPFNRVLAQKVKLQSCNSSTPNWTWDGWKIKFYGQWHFYTDTKHTNLS